MITHLLLVAAGGAIGASLRYLSGIGLTRLLGAGFPYGTMFVNVAGSFAMGVLIAWLARRSAGDTDLRLLVATGLLGGFTTFSAFSLDAVTLYERGALMTAAFYVLASVLVSIAALVGGLALVRGLAG